MTLNSIRKGVHTLLIRWQKDSAGVPPGRGGMDHRYRYAKWDGKRWNDYEIAFAGTRLYAGEDDYTGNIALDPNDPDFAYISANVDPQDGSRLPGNHYEIFKGATSDDGRHWTWTPLTEESSHDNLRPVVPSWNKDRTIVLWLRGVYTSYTDYDLDVVGMIID